VVLCNGTAASITTLCPQKESVAACVQLQSSKSESYHAKCSLHSQTTEGITCLCDMSLQLSNDRLLLESTDGDDGYYASTSGNANGVTIDIGTMLTTVATDFTSNWKSAGDLSLSDVVRGYDVLVTMGVVLGAIVIALIFSYRKDHILKVEQGAEDTNNRRLSISRVFTKSKISSTVQSIESVLPLVFRSAPFPEKFIAETKKFHRWFGVIFYFSPNFPRVLRVVSLSTAVIIMLFIQAVTYNIAEADDGSCESHTDNISCLEERSTLARGESKCYWDNQDYTCHFSEPSNDLLRVVFVAIISALWSAPIAIFVEWTIMRVLAAKTSHKAVDISLPNLFTSVHINERMSHTASRALKKTVNEEISDLSNAIKQYYDTLPPTEQRDFAGMCLIACCYLILTL
jgi:hypothetical protein